MALSTTGPDGVWTTPLGFVASDDLVVTFLSKPESRHVRDIEVNPLVSLAIFSADGDAEGNVGLQIRGVAQIVEEGGPDEWWRFRVEPREVWVYDSRVPGRQRQPVDPATLAEGRG